MARVAKKRMNQTWRAAVAAQAGPAEAAALRAFDEAIARGAPEHVAAYRALEAVGGLAEVDLPGDPSPTLAQAEKAQIAPDEEQTRSGVRPDRIRSGAPDS